ncbi:daptide biosynthesis intramembrane metalloprotease [Arthrobacter sp. MA-N2]|uniref:daptide biosynthesis intramembrane metalloprotease n=1 Tax=Arthrobacter sp. MA-N2 TaxID=1101188 RepID=UPI000487042B|nr:daptide biosynthesis intramembrane metalloprotease [Arthrobacter sp. MA-N2]
MTRTSDRRTAVQWPVQLAPSASVDEPLQADGPWIVAINGVPKARVSHDVANVLRALDGKKDPAQVAHHLGNPWTADDVRGIVRQLVHTGVFDVTGSRAETRRIQFRAPLTVQLTLFNPAPFLKVLRPAVAAMVRPGALAAAAVLVASGIVGALTAGPNLLRVLATPLPLEAYLFVAVAMFASTLLHELGHGMALVYFGGTPRRIGIMLFYLAPAFFCDVTDGWRLCSRKQRVLVALAGPLVHLGLGSVALAVQSLMPATSLRDAATLYGIICYAIAVLNLFPFIKMDGYIALMSALDIPHLRRKSITALADVVSHRLLGSRVHTRGQFLFAWFGGASLLSGIAFMVIGFQRLIPIVLQLGYAGHIVVFVVVCLLLVVAAKGVTRFLSSASRRGSPAWRRIALLLLGTAAAAGLLTAIPVTSVVVAGYTYSNGELKIVTPNGSPVQAIAPGDAVTLKSQGMVVHEELARATIGAEPPSNSTAPLETILPVTLPGTNVPVLAYQGCLEGSADLPVSGRAEVTSKRVLGLGEWLWSTASNSPLWPDGFGQAITHSGKGMQ